MPGETNIYLQVGVTVLGLVLVLALAWWLLRLMNRSLPGMGFGGGRFIRVLDRVQAGKTTQLLLVRVKDKVLLVGVNDHAVEKLCELDDPGGALAPPDAPPVSGFAGALRDAARKLGGKNRGDGGGELP